MSTLTIPNSFTANTTILSSLMNANFTAITNWSTNIDHTNIGAAGLYASQLLPTTAAEATFGATATGVGYKFLANDTTAVPLTVSGVSSQSANIFDVTLTSGGTVAVSVSPNGVLKSSLGASTNAVVIGASGTASAAGALVWGNGTSSTFLYTGTTVQTVSGVLMNIGAGGVGAAAVLALATSGNLGIAGTLSQASSRNRKKNIAPWHGTALPDVLAMKPMRYHFLEEDDADEMHLGFIAEDTPRSLVRGGTSVEPYSVAVMGLIAIQEMAAKLKAAGVAGF